MTSKLKTDVLETVSGSGTIALTNQLSGMTSASVPLLTDTQMPAGSVVQVVHTQNQNASHIASTSQSFVASGIQASITPTKVGNRIMVEFISTMATFENSNYIAVRIYVGGNEWLNSNAYQAGFNYMGGSGEKYCNIVFCGELAASNLNAIAIEPYFKCGTSGTVRLVHAASSYSLKLTEIKQ